jgi:hypothetical protein
MLYESVLKRQDPGRILYLAVPEDTHNKLFASELWLVVREQYPVRLLVFDPLEEVVERWQS